MKKILLFMSVVFTAFTVTILSANTTYASTNYLSITGFDEVSTIHFESLNQNANIYIDGVNQGSFRDYLDNYADSFTTPNMPYAIEIKGASNQPISILGYGTVNTIHIGMVNNVIEIYTDGTKLGQAFYNFIDREANFTSPNIARGIMITSGQNQRPAISGQENFVTSVDDAKDINFFKSYLTAIDDTDGNITDQIYVKTDNYTTNKAVLGTYTVVFAVKDAAQNESTLEVSITVVDVTKPVITGNSTVAKISYTQTWNITNFKTTLSVTDNYASLTNADITVKTDGYTTNKSNLGTYNVVFAVVDPSGNEGTFTKQVEVIDDVAPVFSGPTVLTKPNTSILTVNEIKAQLTATDAKEGNKTAQITVLEDKYTGNGNKVGNYTITFQVQDSKGNKSTHVVTISVQDNIPPVWYIQDGVTFKIVPPATLTRQQIIDLLVATNQLSVNATTQINFLVDDYTGNEKTPGVYTVSLGYSDTAGNEGVHTLAITVLEDETTNPIVVNPDDKIDIVGFLTSPTGLIILGVAAVGLLFVFSKNNKKSRRR